MASKASMLKQGVNRTGKGLFNGMQSLNAGLEAEEKVVKVTSDTVKAEPKLEISTETVKEIQEEKPVVKEEKTEEIIVENKEPEPQAVTVEAEVIPEAKEEKVVVTEEINSSINKPEKPQKAAPEKSSSRYEKEKFLLLDIRGYRDYVEHMAKASNTSATKYIRNLIQMDMDQNMDIYEAHKALEEKLKGRTRN